jgi:hypothetical protein
MQRELSYQLPFERLTKLSRTASRKAYPKLWWLTWLWLVLPLATLVAIVLSADSIHDLLAAVGIPFGTSVLFVVVAAIFFTGVYALRRMRMAELKGRATFNATIRMTQDEGGLRFATEEVEHYLKWRGIGQILFDRDGVIVSHGNLFFLIPDRAFAGPMDRLAFIQEVYGRLGERARSASEKHVRAALRQTSSATT